MSINLIYTFILNGQDGGPETEPIRKFREHSLDAGHY
jgi:hypothetical protein